MARLFVTGITGYIGGDVFYRLQQSSLAKLHISCLVRDASKARQLSDAYPNVNVVQGDLGDSELMEKEARNADIVLNLAATGHAGAAAAIAKAIKERVDSQEPACWIQIGGASVFAAAEIAEGKYGRAGRETYDDLEDSDKIKNVIRNNKKRVVENLIISQPAQARTALLIIPLIYGQGRGPGHQRSIQAPEIARCTIQSGHGFRLGAGQNTWSNIHIHDLSDAIVALTEAASDQQFGLRKEDHIYCLENGKMSFGDLCSLITMEAHKQGLIDDPHVKEEIDAEKADRMSAHAAVLWGTNAMVKSSRAQARLGWTPTRPDLSSEVAAIVKSEAASQQSQR